MKFRADITTCENGRDKILSAGQCGPDGELVHLVIIQRSPKEYDVLVDTPGPVISYEEMGLDLEPGPERITFSQGEMIIELSDGKSIDIDITRLSEEEQEELRTVAKELYR